MHVIKQSTIEQYQQNTFRSSRELHLETISQARDFIDERGFIFFWPVQGFNFPSLWTAVAGNRPVADQHDDPGHISWNWKDSGLDKKIWYYARILRKKNTFISLKCMPFFYSLSPNYGTPEEDIEDLYGQGKLSLEAKLIFEALLRNGPLDTITLRKEAHLTGTSSQSPFDRALAILQQYFFIQPVRVSQAGAWKYAFVYDLTIRNHPEIIEQTRFITEQDARKTLLRHYYLSVGAASSQEAAKFFSWPIETTTRILALLVEDKVLFPEVSVGNSPISVFSIPQLVCAP